MKKILFYLLMLGYLPLTAQEDSIQWASKILKVSSEFTDSKNPTSKVFRASQVLGKPSNLAFNQENPCAWKPAHQDKGLEHIVVGFDKAMKINRVLINESFNPGAIIEVWVINQQNIASLIYKDEAKPTNKARCWNLILKEPMDSIVAVEVKLDTKAVPGFNQIDAIGIAYIQQNYRPGIKAIYTLNFEKMPQNLGKKVNSEYQEIAPFITPDGKRLYFTRSKHPLNTENRDKQDIWFADLVNDSLPNKAQNLGKPINTPQHNSCFPINSNEKLLLNNIYNTDGTLEKGLSIAQMNKRGEWSQPKKVLIKDYYNRNTYSEFFLNGDEQYLLMTVERDEYESLGFKDIYVSFKKADGSYSKPQNLGKTINTAASETSPFLHSDNRTLFFSTSGHLGYGSNDIFVSYRLDDTWTNWTEPQNLGPWINTPEWDAYFSVTASGEYIYFTSYKNSLGDSDIFRVKLNEENRRILFREK
jgi:hypothetical protein